MCLCDHMHLRISEPNCIKYFRGQPSLLIGFCYSRGFLEYRYVCDTILQQAKIKLLNTNEDCSYFGVFHTRLHNCNYACLLTYSTIAMTKRPCRSM